MRAPVPIHHRARRAAALIALCLGLTACAVAPGTSLATPTPAPSTSETVATRLIAPPATLVKPGTLTFLTDTNFPPQESIDPVTNKAVGFDIDIANAIAAKMGLTATIQTVDFPNVIPDLLARKGDAIISGLTITPERQKRVAFVGYFQAGQSILVRKGNPLGIKGLSDLCGRKVGVQVTTTEQDTLSATNNGACKTNKINVQTFPSDADAVLKLKLGIVDAVLDDSPVTADYVKKDSNTFEVATPPLLAAPQGIAVDPKNAELLKAIQQAMLQIYEDGTYRKILIQWNLLDGEIPAAQIIVNPTANG